MCQQTEQAIRELEKQGLSFVEAKRAVQEEWMYLPDEREVPLVGERRDREGREEAFDV